MPAISKLYYTAYYRILSRCTLQIGHVPKCLLLQFVCLKRCDVVVVIELCKRDSSDSVTTDSPPSIPAPLKDEDMSGTTNYYSEETRIIAPAARTKVGTAAPKIYGKELRDLDDADLEGLLSKLSPEELEDLNSDFDPDNSLLPPSQRCRNQTSKQPTGPYQRDKLLLFLEESAKQEEDWEEWVPFSPGIKRELDLDDEDDLDEALHEAPEKDLVDLAGILGMHNLLNQSQYYNALKSSHSFVHANDRHGSLKEYSLVAGVARTHKKRDCSQEGKGQDETTGTTFSGVVRAFEPKILPEEPENETDVDDCIRKLEANDEMVTEININNMKRISKERIKALIKASCASKHIKKLSLANTAISDQEARGLVELLETSPSLRVLNVESNFITPELLAKLLRATLATQNLTEFHAENQRASVLGNQIEMDMMLTVEENESLLRVGVSFQSMEARHRVSEALERNYERRMMNGIGQQTFKLLASDMQLPYSKENQLYIAIVLIVRLPLSYFAVLFLSNLNVERDRIKELYRCNLSGARFRCYITRFVANQQLVF
ncbi:Tropomodulin [Dirofilaria immitis]|nr:Tropomodulin [Dirofilaria immitis]